MLCILYTSDLPVTLCRRAVYADVISCAVRAVAFTEMECALMSALMLIQVLSV